MIVFSTLQRYPFADLINTIFLQQHEFLCPVLIELICSDKSVFQFQ